MPSAAPPAVAPAASEVVARAPLAGWVPQRSSVARLPFVGPVAGPPGAEAPVSLAKPGGTPTSDRGWRPPTGDRFSPRAVAAGLTPAAAVPPALVPDTSLTAEAFWASAGWAPAGLAQELPDNGRHRRPGPPKPAVLTIPLALRGVRARPRRLAVLGVLVLLVAVAGVFGIRVAWASSSARPEAIPAAAHGPPGGLVSRTVPAAFATTGAPGSPAAAPTTSVAGAGVLLIHVVGQVRRPGVVRLPPGSRVLDAVDAAGGSTASADLNHLNLARVLVDGEQIVVPKPGEVVPAAPGAAGAGSGSAGAGSAGGTAGALVSLNTADAAALDSLPGVGPVLSQRILDWRTQHGRFSTIDELGEVSGIGDKLLSQIRPKVTL
jgi:competence protein ComEA